MFCCYSLFQNIIFLLQAKYDANQEKLKAESLPYVNKNEPNLLLKYVDKYDDGDLVKNKTFIPEVPKKNGYIRIPHMMNGSPNLQNV